MLPYGFGKLLLAHPRARYPEGVFEREGTVMHVSPGLGTTFVPFRFFARPEATELVLRCRLTMEGHSVISPEVLARYAADAAAEVPGVHTKQRRGARVNGLEVEVHVVIDYGASIPDGRRRGAEARDRVPRPDGGRQAHVGRRDRRRRPALVRAPGSQA